jgi:hypothetical protein
MRRKNILNIKRKISNPMTVIAIFAFISETSAAVSLPFLDNAEREIYIWFLISFPFYLLLLFFITLNFNYRSLYAPSDFDKDDHFLKAFEDNKPIGRQRRADNSPDPPLAGCRVNSPWVEYCIQLSKSTNTLSVIDVRLMSTQSEFEQLKEDFPLPGKHSPRIILFLTASTSDAQLKPVILCHIKHIRKTAGSTIYMVYNASTQVATTLRGH